MDSTHEALIEQARRAGLEAYSEAMCWHRPQLDDRAPNAVDAFWLWATAEVSEADWDAVERAFTTGWESALDAQ